MRAAPYPRKAAHMNSSLKAAERILDLVARVFEWTCIGVLAVMLTINAGNIASRAVLDQPLNWVWPWTMVLFLWWVMLAFYPLYRRRKDVSIYIVLKFLGPMARRMLGVFVHLAILAAAGLLLYTIPERLASSRGLIEIVALPREVLIYPLLFSSLPIFLDALVALIAIAAGKEEYTPFGMIEVAE